MVGADAILRAAAEQKADIIGLSGLITPSLEEMVHVAQEMERRGVTVPLLIGGATTSRAHTAVKIAPAYSHSVVHVLDASRAVTVVSSLKNAGSRAELDVQNRREQERLRIQHAAKAEAQRVLSLAEARRRRPALDWDAYEPPRPAFTGVRAFEVPLAEIVPYIDWTPFFVTWELRGTYPRIFENEVWGARAREVFDDAQALLRRIVEEKLVAARAVYGFFPAQGVGDDIALFAGDDDARTRPLLTLHTLRQQTERPAGQPHVALADFVAPRESSRADWLGGFAVTAGLRLPELVAAFEREHDDYGSIMAKALADRLAEALAEKLHEQARRDWGYGRDEHLSVDELIRERYRGIRPAPGYPACPDHTEKGPLFELLRAEENAGIHLTETFAMDPAASVCGLYLAHPEAKYFTVGRIGDDQVADYARRKGMDVRDVERWLAPNLAYEQAVVSESR
jgi:5-methyltetrahydrofolate--homocysteine methyltransferase